MLTTPNVLTQQILNHMDESAVYNESDLAPFHRRLGELRGIVQHDNGSGKHPKPLITLLERQLNECGVCRTTRAMSIISLMLSCSRGYLAIIAGVTRRSVC